jgi:hypothetical protein
MLPASGANPNWGPVAPDHRYFGYSKPALSTLPADATAAQKISYTSVDDVLGPGEHRFFGTGYKRAEHRLTAIRISGGAGPGKVEAHAAVGYPADWSRKDGVDQRPHLSTVDAIVIGAQLSEMYLVHAYGVSREQARRMALRRLRVKAGTRPVEDELAGFPVTARAVSTRPVAAAGLFTTIIDCVLGTLRVRLEIRHETRRGVDRANETPGRFGSPEELLGDGRRRLFGEGYKAARQLIEDVTADFAEHSALASVRILPMGRANPVDEGLEARHRASASPIDCFVAGLQLGQVLLYGLDGIPRARSSTLWMRETVIELDVRRRPAAGPAIATAALDRLRLLENGGAETWRCADIVSGFHGIRFRCSVAHRLAQLP